MWAHRDDDQRQRPCWSTIQPSVTNTSDHTQHETGKKLYYSVINGFEICGERDIMERDKNKIKKKKNIQIELEK